MIVVVLGGLRLAQERVHVSVVRTVGLVHREVLVHLHVEAAVQDHRGRRPVRNFLWVGTQAASMAVHLRVLGKGRECICTPALTHLADLEPPPQRAAPYAAKRTVSVQM